MGYAVGGDALGRLASHSGMSVSFLDAESCLLVVMSRSRIRSARSMNMPKSPMLSCL